MSYKQLILNKIHIELTLNTFDYSGGGLVQTTKMQNI